MSGLLTMPFCVEGVAKSKNTLTEKTKIGPNNETSSMKVDGTQEVNICPTNEWGLSGTWEYDIVQGVL